MKLRMYLRGFGLGIIMTALVLSFGVKTENGSMSDAQIRQRALELGMVDEDTTLASDLPKAEKENLAEDTVSKDSDADVKEDEKTELIVSSDADSEKEENAEDTKAEDSKENEPKAEDKKTDDAKAGDKEEVVKEEPKPEESKAEEKVQVTEKKQPEEKQPEEKQPEEKQVAEEKPQKQEEASKKEYTLTVQGGYSSDRVAKILEDAGVIDSASSFDKYLCDNGYDNRISVGTYKIPAGADYLTIAKMITRSK